VRAARAATLRANMGTLTACTTSTSRTGRWGCASNPSSGTGLCRRGRVAGFRVSSLTTPGGIRRCLHRITSPRSTGSFQVGLLMAFLAAAARAGVTSLPAARSYNAPAPLVSKWA
jgi:hypothetical protein